MVIKVGEHYESCYGTILEVVQYEGRSKVTVLSLDSGYRAVVESGNLRKGTVRDRLFPTIYGVGYIGNANTRAQGKMRREYILWRGLLTRCYDDVFIKTDKSYIGCTVSENFKSYEYFCKWCSEQIGFNAVDDKGQYFHLDKDILVKGNKMYSEDTCCFVPQQINTAVPRTYSLKRPYVTGVHYCLDNSSNPFHVHISQYGKDSVIGRYKTEEIAYNVYKASKEAYIKEISHKWKDKIDKRVYDNLSMYELPIYSDIKLGE